jgi:hypothetical protein
MGEYSSMKRQKKKIYILKKKRRRKDLVLCYGIHMIMIYEWG